ncbi:TGS domain-containing protein, partial [Candidatus Micrarchaeota archaeon]|nr:TGS domain-containing protein [Candidatus Micrarchaeota archaeon]
NADPKIADYPFTTKEPEIGMLDFGKAQIQMVEIPALVENAAEEQAELMSIVMNADGIILIYENEKQKQTLMNELYNFGIERQVMFVEKGEVPKKEAIFNFYDLIRVYTKEPGEERSAEKPIVMKRGTTVIETAQRVHKDFAKKFRYARVWGSARFPGQRVEKDYVLKDNDTVEFHAE